MALNFSGENVCVFCEAGRSQWGDIVTCLTCPTITLNSQRQKAQELIDKIPGCLLGDADQSLEGRGLGSTEVRADAGLPLVGTSSSAMSTEAALLYSPLRAPLAPGTNVRDSGTPGLVGAAGGGVGAPEVDTADAAGGVGTRVGNMGSDAHADVGTALIAALASGTDTGTDAADAATSNTSASPDSKASPPFSVDWTAC